VSADPGAERAVTRREPVRLGGMALENGVLVHGPRHWACAIRSDRGGLLVGSGEKSIRSTEVAPGLRAPARVAELLAVLPAVHRALPEARLPFLSAPAVGAMLASTLVARSLRSSRLSALAQEAISAVLASVPAAAALRGSALAAYHGAEHITIGSYEHGERRPREHERCGSHMLGPLLVATTVGNVVATKAGATPQARAAGRVAASVGALAAAGELFAWMLRNPEHPVGRALAWPGRELQSHVLTKEPTPEQLEVAEAALAECLRLEEAYSPA
jgi:hypothetical protein